MIYTKTATEHARKNIGGQYDNNLDVWQAGCMFLAYDRIWNIEWWRMIQNQKYTWVSNQTNNWKKCVQR